MRWGRKEKWGKRGINVTQLSKGERGILGARQRMQKGHTADESSPDAGIDRNVRCCRPLALSRLLSSRSRSGCGERVRACASSAALMMMTAGAAHVEWKGRRRARFHARDDAKRKVRSCFQSRGMMRDGEGRTRSVGGSGIGRRLNKDWTS